MKIHFAITGYLPDVFGGAEVYTHHLAKSLSNNGHRVTVTALNFSPNNRRPSDENFDGIEVHRWGFVRSFRPPSFYAIQFYPELYDEAFEFFKTSTPDVVHVTNAWFVSPVALAALNLHIPVVATHVDFLWTCKDSHLLGPDHGNCIEPAGNSCRKCYPDLVDHEFEEVWDKRQSLYRLLAQGYAYHHCPCPLMRDSIVSTGASSESTGVWSYGVPKKLADQQIEKEQSSKLRLGFAGRWNRIKGIDILLDAMDQLQHLPDIELSLFGEQESWNTESYAVDMMAKAIRLKNVRIEGRFMPHQINRVHATIDALVVPSIWPENSPVSILESLACGTPVICADGEGMSNIVRHQQNGLQFENRNPKSLAKQIIKIHESRQLLRKITRGTKCLRTIDEDAIQFEKIYKNALPPENRKWHAAAADLLGTLRQAEDSYLSTKGRVEKKGRQPHV